MGKTPESKRLKILLVGMEMSPGLKKMQEQGHTIDTDDPMTSHDYDIVMGPPCHFWEPTVMGDKHLEAMVKRVRSKKVKK